MEEKDTERAEAEDTQPAGNSICPALAQRKRAVNLQPPALLGAHENALISFKI